VKPEIGRVLEVSAMALMVDVAPNVAPSYRQASVFASAMLLTCIREELDRVASRRVEENRALRALFADAAPGIEEASLRERLARAGAEDDGDLRISALEARNASLRELLIELHAHVEAQDSPEARRVEASIWRELAASSVRRKLGLNAF
jgi:hypothetical protein